MSLMSDYTVLLVPGEQEWTSKALHLACAMARSNDGEVILVKMVPAGHPALLGTPEGYRNVTSDELRVLGDLVMTGENYGVPVNVTLCQYVSYARAMVDAAEQLGAAAVFARLPKSHFSLWARYQTWRVRSILARHGCTLHTVELAGGPLEWTPSATQTAPASPMPRSKESKA